ncbi:MAG: hypothetical protein GF349_00380 [Candidatus Magasanikbacteria bacterium]|nr:hypothetical protein [Candidatus Magasanikbacteria bacterium]
MPAKKTKKRAKKTKKKSVDADEELKDQENDEEHEFSKKELAKNKKKKSKKTNKKKAGKKKTTKKKKTNKKKAGKKNKSDDDVSEDLDLEEKKDEREDSEKEDEEKDLDAKDEDSEDEDSEDGSEEDETDDTGSDIDDDSVSEFEKYLEEVAKKEDQDEEDEGEKDANEEEETEEIEKDKSEETEEDLDLDEKKDESEDSEKEEEEEERKEKKDSREEDVDEKLVGIYENEDGSMPDMKQFKKKKRNKLIRAFFFLIFSVLVLGAVAWAGFFYFQPQANFSEEDVVLSVTGDEEVQIGEVVHYRVRFHNSQNIPLSQAVLRIKYPKGFVFESSSLEPTNENNDEWVLGSIDEGSGDFIDITGKLYGNIDEEQSFRVFLNYTPSNFSSEFQKVGSLTVSLKEFPMVLEVDTPEEVVPGVETEFNINLSKDSEYQDKEISHIAVLFEGGEFFNKKSSDPESDEFHEYRWSFDNLEENRELHLNGVFNVEDDSIETQDVLVKVVGWKDENRDGDGYVYKEEVITINLLKTDMASNLVINGTTNDFSVQPGEMLNNTVAIRNAGENTLNNIRVMVSFEGPSHSRKSILKWSDFETDTVPDIYGEQLSDDTRLGEITWTSSQIPELAELGMGESVMIDFQLPVKTIDDIDLTAFSTYEIKAVLEVQYDIEDEKEVYSSTPIIMTVNSDTSLEVRDQISSNSQDQDVHTVTWFVENNFHELENIYMEADIYGDISFEEEALVVPAGEAIFDEENKKIIWEVDKMPTSLDVLALQFDITILEDDPTQTNLTSKVKFKALDKVTGKEIILMGDEILLNEEEVEE